MMNIRGSMSYLEATVRGLRGGAGNNNDIFKDAIYVAKQYGIKLGPGGKEVWNKADGNCLYESIMDNINSRECFSEELDDVPQQYRMVWNMEGLKKIKMSEIYPGDYPEEEWEQAFEVLQTTSTYDLDFFGDFAIVNCAQYLRKDILVFNTPWTINGVSAHSPIYVISPDQYDSTNVRDTEIPLVIGHDGTHFESLIPCNEDIKKTIELVKAFKTGKDGTPENLQDAFNFNKKADHKSKNGPQPSKKSKKTSDDKNHSSDEFENDWDTVKRKKKANPTKTEEHFNENVNKPKILVKNMNPEQKREYQRQKYQIRKQNTEQMIVKIKQKDMTPEQLREYKRIQEKKNKAKNEEKFKAKHAENEQKHIDRKKAENEDKFKAKNAENEQKHKDKKRAENEDKFKAKHA